MIAYRTIERKRDGHALSAAELEEFLWGYLKHDVTDDQMAALLMAIYFQGMSRSELDTLVSVMLNSGEVLPRSPDGPPRVDKHSTGGVGDKVSLVLAPLAAELGLQVPMMSGRGLGHTGGTLDKLESIPGFRTDLSVAEATEALQRFGFVMMGQTSQMAPLDRRLYALRSVTGTVPAIPLIAASIMSKKLGESLDGLVLDVKLGAGAFLPDDKDALTLARTMVEIGEARGVVTSALLTPMDSPLGRTAGNALEVYEAVECLKGEGPPLLRELVLELAREMMSVAGTGVPPTLEALGDILDSGAPLQRFLRLTEFQGGDPGAVDDPTRLPGAPVIREVRAPRDGFVVSLDPRTLGYGVVALGGGRRRLGDEIHPGVGYRWFVDPGDPVEAHQVMAQVHAADEPQGDAGAMAFLEALELGDAPPPTPRRGIIRRVAGTPHPRA
ncbi:MAG: thymidine phosphorylase [Gemmatimonadota bacterium]